MKKVLLVILVTMVLLAEAIGQIPTFRTGDFVRISWIAPADTDVVKYNAYFINQSESHTTTVVEIKDWTSETSASKTSYILALVAGEYELLLTAVDRAGNESLPSDAYSFTVINDLPPGRPLSVIMELVSTQQAAAVSTSIVKIPAAVKNIRAQ